MSLSSRLLVVAVMLFTLVITLGLAVTAGYSRAFDFTISRALNLQSETSAGWLILLMQGISWIGGGIQRYIIVIILTLALWRWWGWRAGLAMGVTTLVSASTSDIMKLFFARVRPDLVAHLDPIASPSFPSGHANNAAVVYILFIMLVPQARHPWWQFVAAAMIVLTGLSRIMLGVHWPTDVLGGWMLGTSFALGAAAVIAHHKQLQATKFPSILAP